jgi:hypothetical protein
MANQPGTTPFADTRAFLVTAFVPEIEPVETSTLSSDGREQQNQAELVFVTICALHRATKLLIQDF